MVQEADFFEIMSLTQTKPLAKICLKRDFLQSHSKQKLLKLLQHPTIMRIKKTTTKKRTKQNVETVVVMSAHSDDYVLGVGGTIAKYVQEGKKVYAVVFCTGEMSHPWMKERIIKKLRWEEALQASKILGCSTLALNLKETKVEEMFKKNKEEHKLIQFLKYKKPTKIITHSPEDYHPDHKAVYRITKQMVDKLNRQNNPKQKAIKTENIKPEVYIYSIWNPVSIYTSYPSLYVDISKHITTKLKALKAFRSQQLHISYPIFLLSFHNLFDGLKIRAKAAEKFFRVQ
ncbi:PIG-L family deacetylase [Candidatus Woesearchaeota archaeon]|nr:PIG-L family deacetylase [Candidatus Woesearchaeota archaeon]